MKIRIERPDYGQYNKQQLLWMETNYGKVFYARPFFDNYIIPREQFIHKKDCVEVVDTNPKEPTELQKLQWGNTALRDALQYLVDTKEHKDTIGKDSLYMSRQRFGWIKARNLLKRIKLCMKK